MGHIPEIKTWGQEIGGTLISSINKTDRHDKIEILLKVALYTITLSLLTIIL
jgi:hypothetical protein